MPIPHTQPQPDRGPIAWMAGHSVAANLIMLLCLVGGFLSMRTVKQEVFPDFDVDAVQVSVAYPGATPADVESGIVLAVEEAVRGLDDVDEVISSASEGMGVVTVRLLQGADVQSVAQDIKSEVDRITTFPEDAEEPQVKVLSMKREVMSVVLYGDTRRTVLYSLAERVRETLLQDKNITQVEISGLPPLEVSICISEENLRRYGLTLPEVAARVRRAAIDVPGGGIKTSRGEILVRVRERRDFGHEFARLPILTTPGGSQVLLGDIAEIVDGFADTDREVRYNGKPAILLGVYRIGGQTPLQVAAAVKSRLTQISGQLPRGMQLAIKRDRSEIYGQRVSLLLRNGSFGLVLVLLLLGLFLEARVAFWVMMGIPISFLGSFLVLPATGVSINMISLFAYIIALGIVVDDAIVVGENIYHLRQAGMSFLGAAVQGAREVAMPVCFSVLTNVATFLPLYFVPGFMGKIFRMIPIVVSTTFMISLGESLFVLPAHLSHQGGIRRRGALAWLHSRQQAFSRWFRERVQQYYGPFLSWGLERRYLMLAIAISLLALTLAYARSGRMGFSLFPTIESDFSQARVVLPYGAPVARTRRAVERLRRAAETIIRRSGHPELAQGIVEDISGNTGQVRVMLADAEIRDRIMSTEKFTSLWRETVGEIIGVESLQFAADIGGPGGHGRPLDVELSHTDMRVLEDASSDLAKIIRDYPRVKDVDDGFQSGKEQFDFKIRPECRSLGLTSFDVARQVRGALYGAEALRQQRGRSEIKVMVRLPENERTHELNIRNLMIRTPAGTYVPLAGIADIQRGRSYTTINRRNGRRVIHVSADITPRSKAEEVLVDLRDNILPRMLKQYHGLHFSFEGHQADMRKSLGSLSTTFPIALLLVFGLLAIPFRSYTHPLIVMVSIPFGIVGAVLGHLIMGYDLSILSMFGIVALSGVVVNDSLVLIDFALRREREHGLCPARAVHAAAVHRFRAIMLTTLTTFGGLAPMIFETSRQARFLIPMAISLGFGLLFATLITLLIIPCLYLIMDDIRGISFRSLIIE